MPCFHRHRVWVAALASLMAAAAALGTRPVAPTSLPKSVELALKQPLILNADKQKLSDLADSLRDMTQTNLVLNWNALAQSGLKRDTPVDLHLKNVPYEQVLKTLLEVLPTTPQAPAARPNYFVSDNTLTVTTNAELGKGSIPRLVDLTRTLSYSLDSAATRDTQERNAKLVEQVLRVELIHSGEPLDGKSNHALAIKGSTLAATLSSRGQSIVERAVTLLNNPLKIGQLVAGMQVTPAAKKTHETLKTLAGNHVPATLAQMAAKPADFADQFNVALLPGTSDELTRAGADKPDLAWDINDGGVLLIGPRERMRQRTVLVVYELRDLMRRLNSKNTKKPPPSASDYQSAIVQILQTNLAPSPEPEKWAGPEDLAQSPPPPSALIPYNGLLIVFATVDTHRAIAAALQDMNK